MTVEWTITGVEGYRAALAAALPLLQAGCKAAVHETADLLKEAADAHAPRVTGNLIANTLVDHNIGMADNDLGAATVYNEAPYSRRIELGFYGADSLGRVYCVDMLTHALTRRGWRTADELEIGEDVLTLNPDTWLSEWQPLLAIHRFQNAEVMAIEARTASICATPNHRWLVERYYQRKHIWLQEWRTTETMSPNCRIPIAAKCAGLPTTKNIPDDIVELAAWFWTEGSYDWSMQNGGQGRVPTQRPISLNISQSPTANPGHFARIERLLTRLFGEPGSFKNGCHWHVRVSPHTGAGQFRLDRVACWLLENHVMPPSKVLNPTFITQLTQDQLDLLIEVSLLADGFLVAGQTPRITQAHEGRMLAFEMACVLAGRPITVRPRNYPSRPDYIEWGLSLLSSPWSHAFGSALRTDRDHARIERRIEPEVWCPHTPNGTWLARRNGTVYFTGNSQSPQPFFLPAVNGMASVFENKLREALRRLG